MSDSTENFTNWQPPEGGKGSSSPLEPIERLWVYGKCALVGGAELGNWALHTGNYSLVNPVGSDVFLVDILALPSLDMLQSLTLGSLVNGMLGLAAVMTPVFLFSQLLEHHEKIFEDPKTFFRRGLTRLVTIFLILLYLIVIGTEFMALYMRVISEATTSPIPNIATEQTGFWPMLMMSLALIFVNAAFGLATAHIFRGASLALKGE